MKNPEKSRFKVLYFTLEMSKEDKMNEFFCHLLFKLDKIRIDPTTLKSTNEDSPCPEYVLDLLESEKYQEYIKKFEECVDYVDTERNPTGISKYCENYALTHGHIVYKDYEITNSMGQKEIRQKIDYYVPNDPEETVIIILDNFSNLMSEKQMNKMQTIEKMSKSFIIQRDRYEFCIVGIQHQALCCTIIILYKLIT